MDEFGFKYSPVDKYVSNMYDALSEGLFVIAGEYGDKIIELDSENPDGYVGRLLAKLEISSVDELINATTRFDKDPDYQKAVFFSVPETAQKLRTFAEQVKEKRPNTGVTESDSGAHVITTKNILNILKYGVRVLLLGGLLVLATALYVDVQQVLGTLALLLIFAGVTADGFVSIKVRKVSQNKFLQLMNYFGAPFVLLLCYYVAFLPYLIGSWSYGVFAHHFLNVLAVIAHVSVFVALAAFMYKKKKVLSFISIGGAAVAAFAVIFLLYISPLKFQKLSDGTYAFNGTRNPNISEIVIPDTYLGKPVTKINSDVVKSDSIKTIKIGENIESIGDYAFLGCTGLTSVTIGNSVTSIGNYAFEDCTGLTSIKYRGTKEQWDAISESLSKNSNTGNYTITYNYTGE